MAIDRLATAHRLHTGGLWAALRKLMPHFGYMEEPDKDTLGYIKRNKIIPDAWQIRWNLNEKWPDLHWYEVTDTHRLSGSKLIALANLADLEAMPRIHVYEYTTDLVQVLHLDHTDLLTVWGISTLVCFQDRKPKRTEIIDHLKELKGD